MLTELSSSDWLIEETEFDFADANFKETVFTVGNGYQGTRGSLEAAVCRTVAQYRCASDFGP